MLETVGFAAAIVMGVTLGLLGAGGSIVTVPVLVYMLGVPPVPATAYSLFVVGLTALVGSVGYMRRGLVSYKTALVFAVPALLAVFLTRRFLVPALPKTLLALGGATLTKDIAIMVLFAGLMVAASTSMIRSGGGSDDEQRPQVFNYPLIWAEGLVVGVLTGLVGAGGGFLIIPALVVLSRLPMKLAVGTSLLIIATNSLVGFTGDIAAGQLIDWRLLAEFSSLAIVGIVVGTYLSRLIPGGKLKPAFGWFVLAAGIYILTKEALRSLG